MEAIETFGELERFFCLESRRRLSPMAASVSALLGRPKPPTEEELDVELRSPEFETLRRNPHFLWLENWACLKSGGCVSLRTLRRVRQILAQRTPADGSVVAFMTEATIDNLPLKEVVRLLEERDPVASSPEAGSTKDMSGPANREATTGEKPGKGGGRPPDYPEIYQYLEIHPDASPVDVCQYLRTTYQHRGTAWLNAACKAASRCVKYFRAKQRKQTHRLGGPKPGTK